MKPFQMCFHHTAEFKELSPEKGVAGPVSDLSNQDSSPHYEEVQHSTPVEEDVQAGMTAS